jgi:hypothetical protein
MEGVAAKTASIAAPKGGCARARRIIINCVFLATHHVVRSRLTISRTVFLLNPSRIPRNLSASPASKPRSKKNCIVEEQDVESTPKETS